MNHPEIMAAKMICKSIDALTREIYLLRKSVEEKAQPKQEEKEDQIPPLGVGNEKKIFATGRG